MVRGLNSFREWFSGYESNYVVIGRTACDLLLGAAGEAFRATRDMKQCRNVMLIKIIYIIICNT
jgi:hypothetical protein